MMLEQTATDYAAYLKIDVSGELKFVQDVIDNMLTRLEELTSVLQMIKTKNSDCASTVSVDLSKYRSEVTELTKKINILTDVMVKVHSNVDILEKQVEKAESDLGINSENKIKSLLKPFLKKREIPTAGIPGTPPAKLESVMDNFTNEFEC